MSDKTLALARMEARCWTIFCLCQDLRGDLEGVDDVFLARNIRLIDGLASRSFTRVSDLLHREKGGEA